MDAIKKLIEDWEFWEKNERPTVRLSSVLTELKFAYDKQNHEAVK